MHRLLEARAADYMTRPVLTVEPTTSLPELERRFGECDFNGFPVLEGDELVGVVTKFDILKVFIFTPQSVVPQYDALTRLTAREIMTRDVIIFTPETPVTRILQTLVDFRVKSFPITDRGKLVGIIAREDIMRALRELCGPPLA